MSSNKTGLQVHPMRVFRLLLAIVIVLPAVSRAQEVDAPNLKSEQTAFWLSLGSTVVPTAAGLILGASAEDEGTGAGPLLAGAGLLFGPAAGYAYGGATGRGLKGVGIRFGVGLVTTLGVLAICGGDDGENCNFFDSGNEETVAAAGFLALAGMGAIVFSAIYDIAKVKSHVRRANQRKVAESSPALSVAPVVSPSGGGTVGIVGRLRF